MGCLAVPSARPFWEPFSPLIMMVLSPLPLPRHPARDPPSRTTVWPPYILLCIRYAPNGPVAARSGGGRFPRLPHVCGAHTPGFGKYRQATGRAKTAALVPRTYEAFAGTQARRGLRARKARRPVEGAIMGASGSLPPVEEEEPEARRRP